MTRARYDYISPPNHRALLGYLKPLRQNGASSRRNLNEPAQGGHKNAGFDRSAIADGANK